MTIRIDNVDINITVAGQSLTTEFAKDHSIEVLAFRMVYTAGFALPTYQLIMTGTNKGYFEKFKEGNDVTLLVGSDADHKNSFTCETIGHTIKYVEGVYVLNWGGVLRKNKLDSKFLKSKEEGVYSGNAYQVLQDAWKDITGCPINLDLENDIVQINRTYRRSHRTANNFLVDVFLHLDRRPSFPIATIKHDGTLVIKDFQRLKTSGPKYTLIPNNQKFTVFKEIPYLGKPEVNSFKTYTNRACGYTEITGRNKETGERSTVAAYLNSDTEGWALNKLAATKENEASRQEHTSSKSYNALIDSNTPIVFHQIGLHNKQNLINMSSIQTKVRVEGQYLSDLDVLDIVKLKTGIVEDPIAGLYIVEAIEQGFVKGTGFTNVVYLCRDNNNDIERSTADPYHKMALGVLTISPSKKAIIAKAVHGSRMGLAHVRGIIDGNYLREWERHLVSMRYSALSNFNVFGQTVDLNSARSTTATLKNAGNMLMNKLVRMFISSDYANLFINVIMKDQTIQNLFMGLLQILLGGEIYSGMYQLVSDLIYFDQFLDNYKIVINQADKIMKPDYVEEFMSGNLTFKESVTGELIADIFRDENTRRDLTTMVTEDEKTQTTARVVSSIKQNIPSNVDIPIPDISLSDSDAIKPIKDITNIIVNKITNSLIEKGYVYDSAIVDGPSAAEVTIIKPDGTEISALEARSTMVSSRAMEQMLLGTISFDTISAKKIEDTIGTKIYTRHWGTFLDENELVEFIVKRGFTDKYKTLNCVKKLSVLGGKRIYVALPASEENVNFYINSTKVIMGQMKWDDFGYRDNRGYTIPYIIYYTPESYNNSNVVLEIRKGG